jgi:diguanylate cyclase (GGDEF)-like protein/PAS domain S-box-containing protein
MRDEHKTKQEPIDEVVELRRRITELEALETEREKADKAGGDSEADIRKRLEQESTLREAMGVISSTLDLPSVLTRIAEQMCLSIGSTSVYIASYDQEANASTTLAEYYGPEASPEEQVSDFGFTYEEYDAEFLSTMQANEHYIDHVDDPDLPEGDRGYMLQYGAKSILYIPLWMRERVLGYAEVWESRRRREFTSEEINLCKGVASSAAIAIENARLYEVAQQELIERKRAEEALKEHSHELEEMVEERTAELMAVNEQLRQEVTERKRAEEALRGSQERFRQFFENEPAYCYMVSLDGTVLDVNRAALQALGYKKEELVGTPLRMIYAPEVLPRMEQLFAAWKETGELKDEETVIITKEGNKRTVILSAAAVTDEQGGILHSVSVQKDITERKRAEETVKWLAYYDALTGLPNRTLFNDRLQLALAHARRNQQKLAVMLMDLDEFKEVNDTLGHPVGDELLKAVGERLTTILRESDTICRMGGDEFLLILPEINKMEQATKTAQKILEAIREPLVVDHRELRITTSLGITIYPDDGEDVDTLVRNADIAMYRAKAEGRDNYQRYTPA